jgi:transposase-like protein
MVIPRVAKMSGNDDYCRAVVSRGIPLQGPALSECSLLLNIQTLIDDAKCYETVRRLRWPDGTRCPHCDSPEVTKQGKDDTQPHRQRYECTACHRRFDDLTGTIFANHHQPLRVWILCLYFMGLNLSNEQIAQELDLNPDDAQEMTSQLREGIVVRRPQVTLSGEVECDEVYVVAGHKGHPEAVRKKGERDADAG